MKRKMFFFERLMYVDGLTPINCIITARIRGNIDATILDRAIEKVQLRHPLLCATVCNEDNRPSFLFHDHPPKVPVRIIGRESDDDWHSVTLEEWKKPFRMDREPMVRMVWIHSEDISELLLIGHHCICDGASLITIMKEILQLADRPDTSLLSYPPFQSLYDLLPRETFSDMSTTLKAKGKALLFRIFAMTVKKAQAPRASHYLLYWKAEEEEAAELTQRCKAEGTTPFAAMCVAFMVAFSQTQSYSFKNKIMCPVNIRRFLKHIGPDVMFNYAPTISLKLSDVQNTSFWDLARELKKSMTLKIDRLNVHEHLIASEYLHGAVSKLIYLLFQSRASYDFAFSNVGRLDIPECYQSFKIDSFLGVTVALPWKNATTLITSYFRGQTDLSFISTESFLPYTEAVAIKDKALQLLSEAVNS
jgi:NRPS condensation-like uncharacterized protein